ncbi:MAG: PilX N-terminal domain-containing pilus assembly protein [Thiobacillaceae bacterium]
MSQTVRMPMTSARSLQAGAALVIGLVMLVLLSTLGFAAMGTSILEQRMAANARDRIRAFEAAEAALKACEDRLPALRHIDPIPTQDYEALGLAELPLVAQQPECAVTRVQIVTRGSQSTEAAAHETDSFQVYRLMANGWGMSQHTRVRLETHVRQPI